MNSALTKRTDMASMSLKRSGWYNEAPPHSQRPLPRYRRSHAGHIQVCRLRAHEQNSSLRPPDRQPPSPLARLTTRLLHRHTLDALSPAGAMPTASMCLTSAPARHPHVAPIAGQPPPLTPLAQRWSLLLQIRRPGEETVGVGGMSGSE